MPRHYAPRTPLECVEGDAIRRVQTLLNAGERVGWLMFGRNVIWNNLLANEANTAWGRVYIAELPCDPEQCATAAFTNFFTTLTKTSV